MESGMSEDCEHKESWEVPSGFTPRENDVENVEMDNQKDNCDGEFGNVNNISDEVNFSSGFNTYKKAGGESMDSDHCRESEGSQKGEMSSLYTLLIRAEVVKSIQEVDKLCFAMEASQKAKIKWEIEGDENSKYYLGILNKKRNQLSIRGVLVEGDWGGNPKYG
ncbi:hypothetical protein Tco_0869937 [Tanacetum coccineum]